MRVKVQEEFSRFCVFTRAKIQIFGGSLNAKQLAQVKGKYYKNSQNKNHSKRIPRAGKMFAYFLCKQVRKIIY